jgi:hypothetical protein
MISVALVSAYAAHGRVVLLMRNYVAIASAFVAAAGCCISQTSQLS